MFFGSDRQENVLHETNAKNSKKIKSFYDGFNRLSRLLLFIMQFQLSKVMKVGAPLTTLTFRSVHIFLIRVQIQTTWPVVEQRSEVT